MKVKHALKVMLWFICTFHVVMGLGLIILSGDFVDSVAKMYGAVVNEWSAQFLYILRPLGVFMLALGVLAGGAALHPERNRLTIYVFAGIFTLRALQRVIFGTTIQETFGIDSGRNIGNMILFFGMAAVLVVLDQLVCRGCCGEKPSTSAD